MTPGSTYIATITLAKPKVYCKNCKYRGGIYNWFDFWQWCENKQAEIDGHIEEYGKENYEKHTDINIYTGSKKRFLDSLCPIKKEELNKKGECKYYKRKQWKFWIK